MKKFSFALDTVLSYKEQILEHLQAEHAAILAEAAACERVIEGLEAEQRRYMEEAEEKKRKGTSIREMQTFDCFLTGQRRRIEKEKRRLAEIRIREERKRDEVVEAKKETSSLNKLKEKKRQLYDKELQKQEERFIEEFVSNKNAAMKLRNTATA